VKDEGGVFVVIVILCSTPMLMELAMITMPISASNLGECKSCHKKGFRMLSLEEAAEERRKSSCIHAAGMEASLLEHGTLGSLSF